MVQVDRVCREFRSRFIGKVSPVHFFWGSFDLAVTRFSGRRAPPYPGTAPNVANWVMREAYSHEVSSAGFWPGSAAYPQAAFYSYAYPTPTGLFSIGGGYSFDGLGTNKSELIVLYSLNGTDCPPLRVSVENCASPRGGAPGRQGRRKATNRRPESKDAPRQQRVLSVRPAAAHAPPRSMVALGPGSGHGRQPDHEPANRTGPEAFPPAAFDAGRQLAPWYHHSGQSAGQC
jgi:hypothetical protein